jgi:hypothetical protein
MENALGRIESSKEGLGHRPCQPLLRAACEFKSAGYIGRKLAICLIPTEIPRNRINIALSLHNQASFCEAEELSVELNEHNADDIGIIGMLGFTLTKRRKFDNAP